MPALEVGPRHRVADAVADEAPRLLALAERVFHQRPRLDLGLQARGPLLDAALQRGVQALQALGQGVEAGPQDTDLVVPAHRNRRQRRVLALFGGRAEVRGDGRQAPAHDQPERGQDGPEEQDDADCHAGQLTPRLPGQRRPHAGHGHGNRVHGNDVPHPAMKAGPIAVAGHEGSRGVLRPAVALQAAPMHAPRHAMDLVVLAVHAYLARPASRLGVAAEMVEDFQLGRARRVGRIAGVVGGELDDVVGELGADLLEDAAGHERRAHDLGEEFLLPDPRRHSGPDLLANVLADGQVELQCQVGRARGGLLQLLLGGPRGVNQEEAGKREGERPDGNCEPGADTSHRISRRHRGLPSDSLQARCANTDNSRLPSPPSR